MSCFSAREKGRLSEYQKWDYITLSDFTLSSTKILLSYLWLWFLAIIAVASLAADTYTAVVLLVYDRWSSQIQPSIPFYIAKWIFAASIIFSWVLVIFECLRAIRIMRRGSVAEGYLNSLAATMESIKINSEGTGWRKFLVFAALTKSRKGADYVALFVYFQFQGAVRLILAQGPRQVVNAMTLFSVMQASLVPIGSNAPSEGHSSFEQFFINVKILASKQEAQAVTLFTMLFTLIIWVISALSFVAALLLYVGFLWHYIPKSDGSLSNYCRRKINRRLEKIVSVQVKKAIDKAEARQKKENERARKKGNHVEALTRKPTLPAIMDKEQDSKSPLLRQTSQATLPAYSARAPTRQASGDTTTRHPMYREDSFRRPRSPSPGSSFAGSEYDEDGSLLRHASVMGVQKPLPSRPGYNRADSSASIRQPPARTMTGSTNSSGNTNPYKGRFPVRTQTPAQHQAIPLRSLTAQSQRSVSAPERHMNAHNTGYDDGEVQMPDLPAHYRNTSIPAASNHNYPGGWPADDAHPGDAPQVEMPYQAYVPETYQPFTQQTNHTYPYAQHQQSTYTSFGPHAGATGTRTFQSSDPANYVSPHDPALQNTDFFDEPEPLEFDPPQAPPKQQRTIQYRYPDPPARAMTTSPTATYLPGGRRVVVAPRRVATAPLPEFRGYRGEMGGMDEEGLEYGHSRGEHRLGGYDVYDDAHVQGLERDRLGRLLPRAATAAAGPRERHVERERERHVDRERERERAREW